MEYKVWFIDKANREVTKGNFKTIEDAYAYADKLMAEDKVHANCANAEGPRVFKA